MIHPIIYQQPSEVLPGDPREKFILVGSWLTGWETLMQKRFRIAMDWIAPEVCWTPDKKG